MNRNYYNEIKEELISCEAYKRVKDYSKNRKELESYYNVGKILIEAQGGEEKAKYGNELIKEYSKKLTQELGKGYSERNLFYMRKFYLFQKMQTVSAKLSWSHYTILLSLNDNNEIKYYIDICERYNLSFRELKDKIKSKDYQRLDDKTKNKLIKKEETIITDFVKNPIVIKSNNKEIISEKMLKELILDNMNSFLKELGNGFAYIDNEYKIKIGNKYNYLDLLLFNYEFNSFVVVELKVTELKKEHIGQIEVYMNYIDENIKKINNDKTIGIIICKQDNNYVIKYCSYKRIISREYVIL